MCLCYDYYEVTFGSVTRKETDSICIKATRKPTLAEAKKFCQRDMQLLGYSYVVNVRWLSMYEALKIFDMSDDYEWPIFGSEEREIR